MLEEDEKKQIESEIDFLLREKERRDTERILAWMSSMIAKSHSLYQGNRNPFYNGLTGHIIRKDYRKELMAYAREYLYLKFKEKAILPPLPKT